MVALVWWLIPCTLVPTGCSIFSAYYCRHSAQRELELVKLVPKAVAPLSPAKKSGQAQMYVRLAVLTVALCLIVVGFTAGGTADVLAKAVAICTECVGLG